MKKIFLFLTIFLLVITSVGATMIHYWRGDDTLTDEAINKSDLSGTIRGYVAEKVNNAFDFENDEGDKLSNMSLTSMGSVRSIDVWIKWETKANNDHIMSIFEDATNRMTLYDESGSLYVYMVQNGAANFSLAGPVITDGAWIHAIINLGEGGAELYINGSTTPYDTDPSNAVFSDSWDNMYLGVYYSGTEDYYDGLIDNLYMTNTRYTVDDVTNSWNGGNGQDFLSGPAPDITVITRAKYDNSLINSTVTIKNDTFTNTSNTTNGQITFYNVDGLYNISIRATDYLNLSFTDWNVSNDLAANLTYYKARFILEEKIKEYFTNTTITTLNLSFYNLNTSSIETAVGTNTSNLTTLLSWNQTYNVTINASGYSIGSFITNTSDDITINYTIYLYTQNSVSTTIYYEINNTLLNGTTVTVSFSGPGFTQYNTDNGSLYVDDLIPGNYTTYFEGTNLLRRDYFLTILPLSHNFLDARILSTSEGQAVTFYLKNHLDVLLENVLMTITRQINSSWVSVGQKYTDYAGTAQFNLNIYTSYNILLEAAGYTTRNVSITPLNEEYIIRLQPTTTTQYKTIFDKASYTTTPTNSYVENYTTFSLITSSTGSYIEFFGSSSYFNNTYYLTNVTGSPAGGTASININLTNQSTPVDINYFIKLTGEDLFYFNKTYNPYLISPGQHTFIAVTTTWSEELPAWSKAVIAVFAAVVIMLTFAAFIPVKGLSVIGFFVELIFTIIGWIPWYVMSLIGVIAVGFWITKRDY